MDPTAAFPFAAPFTLQVTDWSELPVTLAAYCELPPSATEAEPVSVILIVEELEPLALGVPVASAALFVVVPQAASNSTTEVLRVAEVM